MASAARPRIGTAPDAAPPFTYSAMYHCHQAMEKSLKAYLTWRDRTFQWTHNLERLVHNCAEIDSSFDRLMPAAEFLGPYATVTRYPVEELTLSLDDANRALQITAEALGFVIRRLPESVQP